MGNINEYGEIIRDNSTNNLILEDIKDDINRMCEEVVNQQRDGTDITPEFAEYILKMLGNVETEELSLEDILEKVNFVYSQIEQEYEQDIKPEFGDYLLAILNNIKEKIPPIPPKEKSDKKLWELSDEQLGKINSIEVVKAAEDSAKVTDKKALPDNVIE